MCVILVHFPNLWPTSDSYHFKPDRTSESSSTQRWDSFETLFSPNEFKCHLWPKFTVRLWVRAFPGAPWSPVVKQRMGGISWFLDSPRGSPEWKGPLPPPISYPNHPGPRILSSSMYRYWERIWYVSVITQDAGDTAMKMMAKPHPSRSWQSRQGDRK